MMAKRRSLRYQSADEVLEDLKKLIVAQKQGRSLDLVQLPRLEELERLADVERRKQSRLGSADLLPMWTMRKCTLVPTSWPG